MHVSVPVIPLGGEAAGVTANVSDTPEYPFGLIDAIVFPPESIQDEVLLGWTVV